MKRLLLVGCLLGALILTIWLVRRGSAPLSDGSPADVVSSSSEMGNVQLTEIGSSQVAPHDLDAPLLGERILCDYGDTNLPPENDLTLMSRLMENTLLLLKSAADRPLSANEDWADLFRGGNTAHERFLPEQHPALNGRGQLVDRWHTPLFFHALGGGRYELRSAGPDQKLWTTDDIHRNADGSFRRGTDLTALSLMDAAMRGPQPATASAAPPQSAGVRH